MSESEWKPPQQPSVVWMIDEPELLASKAEWEKFLRLCRLRQRVFQRKRSISPVSKVVSLDPSWDFAPGGRFQCLWWHGR